MLAIAQALIPNPALLLIDEPSGGLAPVIVKDVMQTIGQLRADGIGVLLVEQLVDQALDIADQIVVLDQGVVALRGDASHVTDLDAIRQVYLGRTRTVEVGADCDSSSRGRQ